MFFVAEAALYRDRWYWYDKQVARAPRHMRLSYQPLTRRWRLEVSPTPDRQLGRWRWARTSTRGRRRWPPSSASRTGGSPTLADIDPDARYNVDFRFRLDVSQLPRPFQIGAVGQADWNICAVRNQRLALENGR